MHKSLLAATAAIALLAGPAMAQTSGPSGSTRAPGSPPGAASVTRAPMPDPLAQEDISKIKGSDVYGSDDKKIGSIDTVLMDPHSKAVDRLVVKAGGVLGLGGHDVAIPVDQFKWDTSKDGFKLAKSVDELKSMPAWQSASAGPSTSSTGTTSSGSTGAARTTTPGTGSDTTTAPKTSQ